MILAVLVVLAAGCGGEEESASEAWAGDFCSAAADWRSSLEEIVGQFQSPADLSAESVRGAVDDGLDATSTFVDEVESLGPPETESGQEAAGIVDSMTSTIESTADDLRSEFDSEGDSLSQLLAKLSGAAGQIEQMVQDLQGSLQQLETLEPAEELGDALQGNEDCGEARAGS
ncbi:MAG: hypothetical protein ACRDLZ_02920 [Gaiellaceae bacterium]